MRPPENNAEGMDTKVKVYPEQGRYQRHHRRKKPEFTPRPKFSGACRALTGKTFSGSRPDGFKSTLDNIAIYVGATCGHNMGMALKARKDDVVPQPDDPKDDTYNYAKYIWQLDCKN